MQSEKEYFEFLSVGRFMLPRAPGGRCFFPPRAAVPGSGEPYEWVESSGRATVYSVTVVQPKPPQPDYCVVLVDLDDGGRMMSRIESCLPQQVHIGMRVQARIANGDGRPVVVFVPSEGKIQ